MANKLIVIIPCYNEEQVLPITAPLFLAQLTSMIEKGKIAPDSRILFVNDGSKDRTWQIICELSEKDAHFAGIAQSRNRGHQNAVLAGLMEAKDQCDLTISIDCDGQDDIGAMEEMVDAYLAGSDVVYGVRSNRDTDSFFKKFTAQAFYKVLRWMGVESVYNHADYRLISARALKAFSQFREVNLFLRGMVPLVGFKSACVYYKREERMAGSSHYPLKKMLALAADGITSLSIRPIRLILFLGLFICFAGFLAALVSLILLLFRLHAALALATGILCAMAGLIMVSLGVVGEYVGKAYLETKARPRYIISERTGALSERTPAQTE